LYKSGKHFLKVAFNYLQNQHKLDKFVKKMFEAFMFVFL